MCPLEQLTLLKRLSVISNKEISSCYCGCGTRKVFFNVIAITLVGIVGQNNW